MQRQRIIPRVCLHCGRLYKPQHRQSSVYCSRACYHASQNAAITIVCAICGAPFRVDGARRETTHSCSRGCAAEAGKRRAAEKLSARFWLKVDQSGGPDACWPWAGARMRHGYGVLSIKNRARRAHRIAWELTHGIIDDGQLVRHLVCDNPPCCNPAHLAIGTVVDNVADKMRKGRHRLDALGR